jgi:V/A-type H+-transporting ATPase subunit A
MSEPVSQATLRIVKVLWGLSSALAYKRHFPAIDWLISYSLYADRMADWFNDNVAPDFVKYRAAAMKILQEEAGLDEIIRLVGIDALGPADRLTVEAAKSFREDYLHQNAFHEVDTYTSPAKQYKLLKLIVDFHTLGTAALNRGAELSDVLKIKVREKIGRAKYIPEKDAADIEAIGAELRAEMTALK